MSLLHEIQSAVLQDDSELGPILLKLRLLAARLGSQPLAEWVKHESDGYPNDAEVPKYRILGVTYSATFAGPFGSAINHAPISPYHIHQFAGEGWNSYQMRESIATVDDLLANDKGGSLVINASNLMLLLQGNVYPDYTCTSVKGALSRSALAAIRHTVRSRVLELTIELEKSVPEASNVSLGPSPVSSAQSSAAATQIAQQIIYGNFTSISSIGDGSTIAVLIGEGNQDHLIKFLSDSGFPESDAKELAVIASKEKPSSKDDPMGPKVQSWLVKNIKKAASGSWKMGISVATELIKEALLKYYGFK